MQALVLELVEGPTLAERIAHGPLPVDEALPIARQIAEALEAAHEQGIVHRDLKPANIKVRPDGTVKVLDFGLAKALEPDAAARRGRATTSPTITSPALTQMGVILGTAAYMSPEQAKGRQADKRSDVWAFGAVLYEMLSGRRAFKGDDVPDTLAAVLRQNDRLDGAPRVDARVGAASHRAMPRSGRQAAAARHRRSADRARGSRSARQRRRGRHGVLAPPRPLWRRAIPVVLSAIVAATLTGMAVWYLTPQIRPAADGDPILDSACRKDRRSREPPPRHVMALSPDGAQMVYAANDRLFLRSMSELDVHAIQGTEHVSGGHRSGLFTGRPISRSFTPAPIGRSREIPVTGGDALTICPADEPVRHQLGSGRHRLRPRQQGHHAGLPERRHADRPRGREGRRGGARPTAAAGRGARAVYARDRHRPRSVGQSANRRAVGQVRRRQNAHRRRKRCSLRATTGHLVYAVTAPCSPSPFDVQRLEVDGRPRRRSSKTSGGPAGERLAHTTSASPAPARSFTSRALGYGAPAVGDRPDRSARERCERLKLPPGRYRRRPRVSRRHAHRLRNR